MDFCPVTTTKIIIDNNNIEQIKKRYIAFDVETTGLSSTNDKIIEVGAVLFENGEIISHYSSLVNPKIDIPYTATQIHNITNEMIRHAPSETVVYPELLKFLGDALNAKTPICAHNAPFDIKFLCAALTRLGYSADICFIDTLTLARKVLPELKRHKQDIVAEFFGFVNKQSHRAVTDAEICGKILWEMLKK